MARILRTIKIIGGLLLTSMPIIFKLIHFDYYIVESTRYERNGKNVKKENNLIKHDWACNIYIYIRNSALITKLTENSIINKRRRRVDFLDISLNYNKQKEGFFLFDSQVRNQIKFDSITIRDSGKDLKYLISLMGKIINPAVILFTEGPKNLDLDVRYA